MAFQNYDSTSHGGESCDFKTTTMADTNENPIDSGKTFFDISVNTDQIGMGYEADIPEKFQQHAIVCDFQTKIWLKVIDEQLHSYTFIKIQTCILLSVFKNIEV